MAGGASSGMQLALNVGTMLIAFVGLITSSMACLAISAAGSGDLTLQAIFDSQVFKPLTYLIGVFLGWICRCRSNDRDEISGKNS